MIRNCLNFFRKHSWSKSISVSIDKRNGDRGYTAGKETEIILRESEVKPGSSEKARGGVHPEVGTRIRDCDWHSMEVIGTHRQEFECHAGGR